MMFMTILMWLIVVLFVVGAVQVARIAYTRKLPNLYWLAANFGMAAVGNLFTIAIPFPLVGMVSMILTSIFMVIFIHRTFFIDRKSPYLYIIGLLVLLGIWQVYSAITNPTAFVALTQVGFAVVWGWQAILGLTTYRSLAHDRTLEDWFKARYLLWFAYTLVMFLISTRMLIPVPYAAFENYIYSPLMILSGIVQYITWVMPEPIRQYLNRNYKPVVVKTTSELMSMSEEELLRQVRS